VMRVGFVVDSESGVFAFDEVVVVSFDCEEGLDSEIGGCV